MHQLLRRMRRRLTGWRAPLIRQYPADVVGSVRHFAHPGPRFEERRVPARPATRAHARAIALYHPQFHTLEEHDRWWGDGYTEWRDVVSATPRFQGHHQPRIPRDLGFYDLANTDVLVRQTELARAAGLEAFCFEYFRFNGKRMMEKPLDEFVASSIDFQFLLVWNNENRYRTADAESHELLVKHDYFIADEDAFIADTARYMKEPRYFYVADQPVFIVQRADLIPECESTVRRWRQQWESELGVAPLLGMMQEGNDIDPRSHGFDFAMQSPRFHTRAEVKRRNHKHRVFDRNFQGRILSYRDVVDRALAEPAPSYPVVKTVMPHWDTHAAPVSRGLALQGSTPDRYEQWLRGSIEFASEHRIRDEAMVFVHAWNAWGHAAYLEPDAYYGYAYLNATYRAVTRQADLAQQKQVLLVGHDAYQSGAQMLLLAIARSFRERFGFDVLIALLSGGPLVDEYARYGEVVVLDEIENDELLTRLRRRRIAWAICNTVVTGHVARMLSQERLQVISLVHEMPELILNSELEGEVAALSAHADHVVFASPIVRNGFDQFVSRIQGQISIRPQGCYKSISVDSQVRQAVRSQLGLQDSNQLVMGAGYADRRKGFDCFLATAARMLSNSPDIHFLWAGAMCAECSRQLHAWQQQHPCSDRLHAIGFTDSIADYYAAADAFYLSSREDPYPSVVLEAMQVGLPVVLRRGATGFDALMQTHGHSVDLDNSLAVDVALHQAINETDDGRRQARIRHVEKQCQLDDYAQFLIDLFRQADVAGFSQGEELSSAAVELPSTSHVLPDNTDSASGVVPFARRAAGKR